MVRNFRSHERASSAGSLIFMIEHHGTRPSLRYSVVVPVYNEAGNIGVWCKAARSQLPPDYEVLICYDSADDDTLPALDRLPPQDKPATIRLVPNVGQPGVRDAIATGMRAANAPVVLVTMADLSDDFSAVERMISIVESGAAVACASRYMSGGSQIGGPRVKAALSRIAGVSLHYLAGIPTHDPTNSFKAYSSAFCRRTRIESRAGFALAMELTVKAHFCGERVEEIPAIWRDRTRGKSRFRLLRWLPLYLRWYGWAIRMRWIGGRA